MSANKQQQAMRDLAMVGFAMRVIDSPTGGAFMDSHPDATPKQLATFAVETAKEVMSHYPVQDEPTPMEFPHMQVVLPN